jgi:hypothetical protein
MRAEEARAHADELKEGIAANIAKLPELLRKRAIWCRSASTTF